MVLRLPLPILLLVLLLGCNSGTGSPVASPTPPGGNPSPPGNPPGGPPPTNSTTCFSFQPAVVDAPHDGGTVSVQVTTTSASCSWTVAGWTTDWIDYQRSGPLYQAGNGTISVTVGRNMQDNFGGCPTMARTGNVRVAEEGSDRDAIFQVLQAGSTGPFQLPSPSCSVSAIPYGQTIAASITAGDCLNPATGGRAKYYTFQGMGSSQSVVVTMLADSSVQGGLQRPLVNLYGPGGGRVTQGDGGGLFYRPPIEIRRGLSCGGTYTIEVTSVVDELFNPTGLGNYTLRLE